MTAVTPARVEHPLRRWVLDLTAVAVLLLIAVIGFWPTFAGPSFLAAAIGGILLGLAIAAVCAWRGWGILIIAGLTVAVYFVFGGPLALPHTTIAGVIPSLDTLGGLALGVVTSWKQLLTTVAPVSPADGHLLVPFLVSLIASVTAASLALRLRHVGWAFAPILGSLALVIALGVPTPAFPLVQGIVFAVGAVIWMSLRGWWVPQHSAVDVAEADPSRAAHMRTRRLIGGVAVLAVAAGVGVAAQAATVPAQPRHVFRDAIIPPFNVRDYVSPLQSFRKTVRDQKEKTLFTATGLPEGARIRLAAMDDWDGVVYNVTEGGPETSSAFTPLRGDMAPEAQGVPATVRIEIGEYSGVWVPGVETVDDIAFDGARADELRRSAYRNTATGTTVVTAGLDEGDAYTVEAIVPAEVSDEQLRDAEFANIKPFRLSNVPEDLGTIAADETADAESPIEKVRALESYFAEGGFFSQ